LFGVLMARPHISNTSIGDTILIVRINLPFTNSYCTMLKLTQIGMLMNFYNNTYSIYEFQYKGVIYPKANVSVLAKMGQIEDFDYEITSVEVMNEDYQPIMILVEKGLDKYLTDRQSCYIFAMFKDDYEQYSIDLKLSELENNEIMRHQHLSDYL
jgi:hypothetical protein